MSINLALPKLTDLKPRITVIGVGGAGGNAINNMIASGLTGVEYVAANTDSQALAASSAERRIQLGINLTEGLGAGSKPEIGEAAAEEALEDIKAQIVGSHMVFIAAGMGGGTGTGAAAVIARIAREAGVLTVGIVTKPFQFEGTRRMRTAEAGIAELKKYVDTLIVIPNQNLFRIANEKTTFAEAFVLADQVLYSGVACIVDLIVKEGLINLDFADVRTVMTGMGTAMMGTGEASGDRRAIRAAEEAIANPLIDEVSLKGAKGLLLSIIGGRDMTLFEVDEAASRVRQEVDPEANIIVGATFDDSMGERIRVAIVASGLLAQSHRALSSVEPPQLPAQHQAPPRQGNAPPQSPQRGGQAVPPPLDPRTRSTSSAPLPLSSLLEEEAPARGMPASPQPNHHREVWRGPGEVSIEETHPGTVGRSYAESAHAPSRAAASSAHAPHQSAHFTPAPPQELPRNNNRRMPEVDDFPVVGQREYRSKAGQYGYGAPPHPAPPQLPQRSRDDHFDEPQGAPQRGGLLRRWSGRRELGSDEEQLFDHRSGQSFFFWRNSS